jgi:hypothetical protein
MKYIRINDTFHENESFIIAVDEAHLKELFNALKEILDHQEDYENSYDAMMNVIDSTPSAERIYQDLELYW